MDIDLIQQEYWRRVTKLLNRGGEVFNNAKQQIDNLQINKKHMEYEKIVSACSLLPMLPISIVVIVFPVFILLRR